MIKLYLSLGFIFATIFSIHGDKSLKNNLMSMLDDEEKKYYNEIIKMRKTIYLQGLMLGFVCSLIFLFINKFKSKQVILLTSISITFVINYFYYILYPKKKYMISILNSKKENKAWLKIYKTMQIRYHVGFLFGLGAAFFMQSFILDKKLK